jgi:heat shock protein HslJ
MMAERCMHAVWSTAACLATLATVVAQAAPPPLLDDVAPPGVWTLAEVDGAAKPWPDTTVQLGVAGDGATILVDTGCERFMATAVRTRREVTLEHGPGSELSCQGDRAAAEATVAPVLADLEAFDVVAGRLHVQGAGRTLVYEPAWEPDSAGVPGAPRLASSDRLDPSRFEAAVQAASANGASWVRDPVQVALLFVDEPSTGRTAIVREDRPDGPETLVRVWLDGLGDDATRARWYEVRLDRVAHGAWHVASARRAGVCFRGERTGALVAGRCP